MKTETLTLEKPIVRGDKEISALTLRSPNVAAMRGVSLSALLNMNVDAIAELLPRISDPQLIAPEIEQIGCPDLLQAGLKIASFFLPTGDQAETA